METEVWDIFHDGCIVETKDKLPNFSLMIEIPYLRNMFPDEGDSIWANIIGCNKFEYFTCEGKNHLSFRNNYRTT